MKCSTSAKDFITFTKNNCSISKNEQKLKEFPKFFSLHKITTRFGIEKFFLKNLRLGIILAVFFFSFGHFSPDCLIVVNIRSDLAPHQQPLCPDFGICFDIIIRISITSNLTSRIKIIWWFL